MKRTAVKAMTKSIRKSTMNSCCVLNCYKTRLFASFIWRHYWSRCTNFSFLSCHLPSENWIQRNFQNSPVSSSIHSLSPFSHVQHIRKKCLYEAKLTGREIWIRIGLVVVAFRADGMWTWNKTKTSAMWICTLYRMSYC